MPGVASEDRRSCSVEAGVAELKRGPHLEVRLRFFAAELDRPLTDRRVHRRAASAGTARAPSGGVRAGCRVDPRAAHGHGHQDRIRDLLRVPWLRALGATCGIAWQRRGSRQPTPPTTMVCADCGKPDRRPADDAAVAPLHRRAAQRRVPALRGAVGKDETNQNQRRVAAYAARPAVSQISSRAGPALGSRFSCVWTS